MSSRLNIGSSFLLLWLALPLAVPAWWSEDINQPSALAVPRPQLIVMLIIDQLRGDYPEHWKELFGADGFERFHKEGCCFANCHYPYAKTVTGAGHASLSTGCMPEKHGIIENNWYDRTVAKSVYCATTDTAIRVPLHPLETKLNRGSGSPERLLVPTFTDVFKEHTQGKAKVICLSIKDRGAVLLGGHKPDAVYWFDESVGQFITSSYYRDQLHPWVDEFNHANRVDQWFGQDWVRYRKDIDYVRYSGPDDVSEEGTGYKQGRTFPHPMNGGLTKPGKGFYAAVGNSPFGNELLLELAKKAIVAERLGKRDESDFLSISFSSNDYVGHCWGPNSQEVLDITLRTDRMLSELFQYLDEQVGKGKYLVVLSSDHGVCPLPEIARQQGHADAGRISMLALAKAANAQLRALFGGPANGSWIISANSSDFYLNRGFIQSRGLDLAEVQSELAQFLKKQPKILAAFTASELQSDHGANQDPLFLKVKHSFHKERSGDVMMVSQPYCFASTLMTGTTHGTPHPYDTHVPLMFFGTNIKPQYRKDLVSPLVAPVVLAEALGMPFPTATEQMPKDIWQTTR